jgi:hypothetical protein
MLAPTKAKFEDDFFGAALNPAYLKRVAAGGAVELITVDTIGNGLLRLTSASPSQQSTSRLHHGGVQSNDGVDLRGWNMRKNIDFGCRFFVNGSTFFQATIGFTGSDDPDNVLAAYINTDNNPAWLFQARRKHAGIQYNQLVVSSYTPVAGAWTAFEIVYDAGQPILKVNGVEAARITDADAVPSTPMVAEWQLWNAFTGSSGSSWSSRQMWVDWWGAQQDR